MSDKSTTAILKPSPVLIPFYTRQFCLNNNKPWIAGPFYNEKMTQSNDECSHAANVLSWRKIQLSRAKLKASSKTSALLSGFAMVAMVEIQLDKTVPQPMLVVFTICTTLLVSVHLLALMISTCILPNIEAICNIESKPSSLIQESPHERLHWYIEIAWFFSTLLGLLLFLCEVAILCLVKFLNLSETAAWSAAVIMIPVVGIFIAFAVHFYHSLVKHKYEVTISGIRELELLREQIEAGDAEGRAGSIKNYSGIHIV